jgi:hypothetical protein
MGGDVIVLDTFVVKGRGKVAIVELDAADCAHCHVGAAVKSVDERYTVAGVERNRVNRPLASGDVVGLLLRPEPTWETGAWLEFVETQPARTCEITCTVTWDKPELAAAFFTGLCAPRPSGNARDRRRWRRKREAT